MAKRPVLLLLGDSITERGADGEASGWVSLLQYRYIRSADVVPRGLSGYNTKCDLVFSALYRIISHLHMPISRWFLQLALPVIERELSNGLSPSLVTLWLGANDAARPEGAAGVQHVPLAAFRANLQTILAALKASTPPDCQFLVITPPPVDDAIREARLVTGTLDRADETTVEYARACVEEAALAGVSSLDVHSFMTGLGVERRAACLSDGLHLSAEGNRLVAEQLQLKIAEAFPALAARLELWELPYWGDIETTKAS